MNVWKYFGFLFFILPSCLFPQSPPKDTLGKDALKKILEKAMPEASPFYIQTVVSTPRIQFIPEPFFLLADENIDVPVSNDAITPSPLLALRILNETGIRPGVSVLIVGKATGYLGAIAASISEKVTMLEFSKDLVSRYPDIFNELGIEPVRIVNSFAGAAEAGFMYDIVIVHGGTPALKPEISSFLRPSGVLIIPITGDSGYQNLLKIQYGNGLTVTSLDETFFPIVRELYQFY